MILNFVGTQMRRVVDFTLALIGLIVISPLLAMICLAIVIDSPGSPLYLARRVGRGGKVFRMWKFRSMVADASKTGTVVTGNRDPRITRVGQFLRGTKLDELPQLINVVMGDMSLVGPRPEAPEIVEKYTSDQRAILAVKPGVTGKVQLESKEESESIPASVNADEYYVQHMLDKKVRSDMEYLTNRTVLRDVSILLATGAYVLRVFVRRVITIFET